MPSELELPAVAGPLTRALRDDLRFSTLSETTEPSSLQLSGLHVEWFSVPKISKFTSQKFCGKLREEEEEVAAVE